MYETNFLSAVFWRNIILLVMPLFLALWILYYPRKWKIKFRLDYKSLIFLQTMLLLWLSWITYESTAPIETIESLGLDPAYNWTLPNQGLFPQNTYIYMNVELGEFYTRDNMNGWHVQEDRVHLLNILTKYFVFIAFSYILAPIINNSKDNKKELT
jgi:hypothetical protein